MSWKSTVVRPSRASLYRLSFANPIGPRPWVARCWFASAKMPAQDGAPRLVPPTRAGLPNAKTVTPPFSAALYETSGIVRILESVRPRCQDGALKITLGAPPEAPTGPRGDDGSFQTCSPPQPPFWKSPSGYGSPIRPPTAATRGSEVG